MKIIQERKPFEDWKLEVNCTGGNWYQDGNVPCSSTLEIEACDLTKRTWSKYPDDSGVDYGFVCPICGCFTNIDGKFLNDHLKNMAKDYIKVKSTLNE
jgi:hypothetical protein